jgi:hypothetical protein
VARRADARPARAGLVGGSRHADVSALSERDIEHPRGRILRGRMLARRGRLPRNRTSARPDPTRRSARPTWGASQEISIAVRSGTRVGSDIACPLRSVDRDFLPPFKLRESDSASVAGAKADDLRFHPSRVPVLRHDPLRRKSRSR